MPKKEKLLSLLDFAAMVDDPTNDTAVAGDVLLYGPRSDGNFQFVLLVRRQAMDFFVDMSTAVGQSQKDCVIEAKKNSWQVAVVWVQTPSGRKATQLYVA